MARIIGAAEDFYRLRVIRLDETDEPDLEWREDILYRTPPVRELEVTEDWVLESVTLDEDETVTRLGRYESVAEAHAALDEAREALQDLTKSQFEEQYLANPDDLGPSEEA
jgi:hypothetical protein